MRELFKEINLSDVFVEHFNGFMLGDGFLSNQNKSKHSAQFLMKNVNPSYILYLSKMLAEEGFDSSLKIKSESGNFTGSRMSSIVYTKFYVTLMNMENKWYRTNADGTHYKIIPDDITLTPNTLLQWYIGDGYLVNLRGNPVRVQFCTDRYTDEEIRLLQRCFKRDFDLDIQIDWARRRLRVPTKLLGIFFSILPDCPIEIREELGYKWINK